MNPIPIQHKVDGYKLDHISQYAEGTTYVCSNMTPRSDKLAQVIKANCQGKMIFFGLQYALKRLIAEWSADFFSQPRDQVMAAYARRVKNYVGPDNGDRGIKAIGDLHDLGYLPLRVKALPEGSRVPMRVPVYVIESTHGGFSWLVNYTETYLSDNTWSMFNAASLCEQYYLTSKRWAEVSGAPDHWLAIANHCFAARGHRGDEDAMTSGMAQLLFSIGTDTLWAIDGAEYYYGADTDKELIGVSVNAFEHATASQRIATFGSEIESLRHALTKLYPRGIFSYVGDTQDLFYLLNTILRELKAEVLARQPDSLGLCKFVVRPDSSRKSPKEIIVGYNVYAPEGDYSALLTVAATGATTCIPVSGSGECDAVLIRDTYYDAISNADGTGLWVKISPEHEIDCVEVRGALDILWDVFGGTVNEKGLRVLHEKVGLIYGEGITLQMQDEIYAAMVARGWDVSNVLFGEGSWAFLKDSSRDTYGVAIKATSSIVNGEIVSMQKTPKTDTGTKHSAKGLIRVELVDGEYVAYDQQTPEQYETGELKEVMRDSHMTKEWTFIEIRRRLGVPF